MEPAVSGERDERRRFRAAPRTRRSLWIAGLISIAVHLLLASGLVVLGRPRRGAPKTDAQGTIELLMVEKKGSGEPSPAAPQQKKTSPTPTKSAAAPAQHPAPMTQPPDPQKLAAATPVAQPPPPAQQPVQKPVAAAPTPSAPTPSAPVQGPQTASSQAPPVASDPTGEPVPPPPSAPTVETASAAPATERQLQSAPPQAVQAAARPSAPPAEEAPVFNLDGTDSDSNATVLGGQIIPASPDDRFRNRPPVYPYEAEVRGEHGVVLVVVHVSEYGSATGADVVETSGVVSLDRAALDAVRKWHFRPALKDGHAVPFDMAMRFVFSSQ